MRSRSRAALFLFTASLAIGGKTEAQPPRTSRPIRVDLDASEAPRRILHAKLVMPVEPGALTLLYPKWIPGEHAPTGPITDLAGLVIQAGGKVLPWQRDEVNLFAIRCEIPAGITSLDISLDLLLPPRTLDGFGSATSSTAQLAVLAWNQVLLYPSGRPVRDLTYQASLTLPSGWKLGTALPIASQSGQRFFFGPVSLETLVDSPVLCGAFLREVPIGPAGAPLHFLEIAADSAAALELGPELKASLDRLVRETFALFGAQHYDSYRFLLALSDNIAHFGLEHHQSSDNRVHERTLLDEELRRAHATLLPHEITHSWNGKYRRPADIATPDFQEPMRTNLLWIYEGLTQYLGQVLTARSGLWSPEDYRDKLALIAEWAGNQKGRAWRPLEDTAVAAQLLYDARKEGQAWRRSTDFYDEGTLIWLDADTLIRERSAGRKSLEDFCRRFHGGQSGPPAVVPYTLDDVVESLNAVTPHDWKSFFAERVGVVAPAPPLGGLERSGWRLTYADTPSPLQKAYDKTRKRIDLTASIGLTFKEDGTVQDVVPGKVADRAGVGPGMKLVAVNSRRFTVDVLRAAIAATKSAPSSLELLLENGDYLRSYTLDYHEGEKYPRLERIPSREDLLSAILKGGS